MNIIVVIIIIIAGYTRSFFFGFSFFSPSSICHSSFIADRVQSNTRLHTTRWQFKTTPNPNRATRNTTQVRVKTDYVPKNSSIFFIRFFITRDGVSSVHTLDVYLDVELKPF